MIRLYQLLKTLINLVLSVVMFFLVTRLVLRFFGANPSTPFVQWIFNISNFLMFPFANIVPNVVTQTGILDMVAIITLLAYLIIGYLILGAIESSTQTAEVIEEEEEYEYPKVAHYHDVPTSHRRKRQV